MRYLFLLYGDPAGEAALPPAERRSVVDGHLALGRELAAAGTLRVAEALGDGVRVLHSDGAVTDGPYAETKEALGGFYLVDARDLDEAIELAARIPAAKHGAIEVRPIWEQAGDLEREAATTAAARR